MAHILSREAGINLRFAYSDDSLPDSEFYLLPSLNGCELMDKKKLDSLKDKIRNGATLYLSLDNAVISRFEELTGLRVEDSFECSYNGKASFKGQEIEFSRTRNLRLAPTSAKVLSCDSDGNPFISENTFGKGKVIFVNSPIEAMLTGRHNAFDGKVSSIYKFIFADVLKNHIIISDVRELSITHHPTKSGEITFVINHSDEEKLLNLKIKSGYEITKIHYGDSLKIKPFDACIIETEKTKKS